MRKEWIARERGLQRTVALLRMDLINFSMRRPEKPVELEDLFAGDDGKPQRRPRMTPKRRAYVADRIRGMFAAHTEGS